VNCPNCGAAMAISAKGYYICAHCGTNAFPEAVDRDGVRVLGPGDPALACSLCKTALVRAMLDEYLIDYCEKCRGVLLARKSFAEIVWRRRAWAVGPGIMPVRPADGEMRRRIGCPKCGARMTTDWYYGPGGIVMDICAGCDLVWLDYGELKQVVDAPGSDRGTQNLPNEDET
jgi:Zn-finger nucleic acid-binding protein